MKKSRKIFAIVLAMLMTFGCFAINVSAAGTPGGNESMQVIVKTNVGTAHPGDYITVTLNIKNNYYATTMRFPILFTSSVFEVVGDQFNLQKLGQLNTVPGSLGVNTTGNPAFYPAGYSSSDYGAVLIQWDGSPSGGTFSCYKQPSGQDCISFQLRIKAGASGSGTILIPPESNLFYRQAMNNPADGNTVYTMTAAACPMTFTPASFTVLPQAPDIAVFPGSGTIIDTQHNYIYGLKTGLTSLDTSIVPIGGATLQVVKTNGLVCGTGTLVKVVSNGSVVKTYTVIIFGDVNGDGNIDSIDAGVIVDVENYRIFWDEVSEAHLYFAGNVNGDSSVDSIDAGILVDSENFKMIINQMTGKASPY